MFQRFVFACLFLASIFFCSAVAFAGKVELTTYYPAPYGEYSSLQASSSFIPPKMTSDARPTATTTPPAVSGMVIFNTDENHLEVYDGTNWKKLGVGVARFSRHQGLNDGVMKNFARASCDTGEVAVGGGGWCSNGPVPTAPLAALVYSQQDSANSIASPDSWVVKCLPATVYAWATVTCMEVN